MLRLPATFLFGKVVAALTFLPNGGELSVAVVISYLLTCITTFSAVVQAIPLWKALGTVGESALKSAFLAPLAERASPVEVSMWHVKEQAVNCAMGIASMPVVFVSVYVTVGEWLALLAAWELAYWVAPLAHVAASIALPQPAASPAGNYGSGSRSGRSSGGRGRSRDPAAAAPVHAWLLVLQGIHMALLGLLSHLSGGVDAPGWRPVVAGMATLAAQWGMMQVIARYILRPAGMFESVPEAAARDTTYPFPIRLWSGLRHCWPLIIAGVIAFWMLFLVMPAVAMAVTVGGLWWLSPGASAEEVQTLELVALCLTVMSGFALWGGIAYVARRLEEGRAHRSAAAGGVGGAGSLSTSETRPGGSIRGEVNLLLSDRKD